MLRLKHQESKIDKTLLFLTLGLLIFGILMIFNASAASAIKDFGDKFYYLRLQGIWAVIGVVLMIAISFVDYHFLRKIALPLFFLVIILLILVLIPGIGLKFLGGRRWLGVGEFSFQPSELAKLSMVFYLSSFLNKRKKPFQFLIIVGILSTLLILEPDLGTALILIFTAFVIYFVSGANILEIIFISFIGILGVTGLVFSSSYRLSRFKVFLNQETDPQGASYHLNQILIALGSGGLFGRGIGQSRQKFLFLPEAATDSIFAVIGEEMGFIGGLAVLIALFVIVIRGLQTACQAPDRFGQMLAVGITSSFFAQSFLNLGSMVSLIPLTGVPLPLISYGRTSLLTTLVGVGILLNISKYKTKSLKSRLR